MNERVAYCVNWGKNKAAFSPPPFNFSRNPTLSVPCGLNCDSMPMSLHFIGRHFDEATLCRVGHACEQTTAWHKMMSPISAA